MHKIVKIIYIVFIITFLNLNSAFSDNVKKIEIEGNERISKETIKLFSDFSLNSNLNENDLNLILKKLYQTGFFKNITLSLNQEILKITVVENPIIENIVFEGLKSNKILDILKENSLIKSRSSYDENLIKKEKERMIYILKEIGYFNSSINIIVEEEKLNLVNLIIEIKIGEKAKIKKISFVGNKIFKDNKLRRIIASSEYKFWKFLTGKKFLNEALVEFDRRLLSNFYKNNGYYFVEINSSFAKLLDDNEFELIFNINAKSKFFFGELELDIPSDFDKDNFKNIYKLFKKTKGKQYSINQIDKILKEIDLITAMEQYQFINATVDETVLNNKINLKFKIFETEKTFVNKINIYGNNITSENVIRNQLEVDEGDPYNEILVNKSINNLKSLNFFNSIDQEITENSINNSKTINIYVEEKPTGEINAQAGIGTDGGSIGFGVKENNFLGQGIILDSNVLVSSDTFRGKFSVTNRNYKNSDKSLKFSAEAIEIDNFKTNGFKTNKTGLTIGTNFEYLDDLFLGIGGSSYVEKIDTNTTASARMQKQEGNYFDTFLELDFNYDKRNQKFQTSSGYKSFYSLDLPIISDTSTLKNYYTYSYYFDLFKNNISNISFYAEAANSLQNKDVKLSERVKIPASKLRGFESGRVGPKDGNDFIGGNYAYSLNFSSNIPQLFPESQNVEFLFFTDVADIWGVDYDSSLSTSEIRSSFGLGFDWFSPIGPMSFSLAQPVTKANTDKTETFRFNLGTTF